ncbi:MAG: nucleotidyltransferase domain-containing protein [Candidatus Peregrinibacteria bacterium]
MGNNTVIAGLLRQIAALLEEQGVRFKPAAYRRAAQTVEELPKDIATCGDEKELMKLPGIGEAIAGKIREYLTTGKIGALHQLLAEQGGIPPALMEVEGLGPKRARILQRELQIQTVADLIRAAEHDRLNGLPGFSRALQANILENAKRMKERARRFPRAEVTDDVETLLKKIRSVPGVLRAEVAGSFRRKKETVGDIDVLVVTASAKRVGDAIAELPIVRDVVAHGEKKLSFDLRSPLRSRGATVGQAGIRVDIRFVRRDQWGAALLYFTGSKEHNIALRKRAMERGWKLNEYGLFRGIEVVASREEEDIYRALGYVWIDPSQRTDDLELYKKPNN